MKRLYILICLLILTSCMDGSTSPTIAKEALGITDIGTEITLLVPRHPSINHNYISSFIYYRLRNGWVISKNIEYRYNHTGVFYRYVTINLIDLELWESRKINTGLETFYRKHAFIN